MSLEQRHFPRLETHIQIDLGQDVENCKSDFPAVCLDLSTGGMKVELLSYLEPKTNVLATCVLSCGASDDYFLETQATVCWCEKNPDEEIYIAGIKFEFLPDEAKRVIEKLTGF